MKVSVARCTEFPLLVVATMKSVLPDGSAVCFLVFLDIQTFAAVFGKDVVVTIRGANEGPLLVVATVERVLEHNRTILSAPAGHVQAFRTVLCSNVEAPLEVVSRKQTVDGSAQVFQ